MLFTVFPYFFLKTSNSFNEVVVLLAEIVKALASHRQQPHFSLSDSHFMSTLFFLRPALLNTTVANQRRDEKS